jgi:hypothetical protein
MTRDVRKCHSPSPTGHSEERSERSAVVNLVEKNENGEKGEALPVSLPPDSKSPGGWRDSLGSGENERRCSCVRMGPLSIVRLGTDLWTYRN